MQMINKDEYKLIPVSALRLSTRSNNCLMQADIFTLYTLIEQYDTLPALKNIGAKSMAEIDEVLHHIAENGLPETIISEKTGRESSPVTTDEKDLPILSASDLPEDILARPVGDLHVSYHIIKVFLREDIKTIGQVAAMSERALSSLKSLGNLSVGQLCEQIKLLGKLGSDYFSITSSGEDSCLEKSRAEGKAIDTETVKKLQNGYGFKPAWLSEWFGVSRQRIYQLLERKMNTGHWCGKELLPEERSVITEMTNRKSFRCEKNTVKYYLLNNMADDCAFLIVAENIKCFFLQDLPASLQALIKSYDLHRLSEAEIALKNGPGKIVHILKKPYYMLEDSSSIRSLASARSLSVDDYSVLLFGLPYCSSKTMVTDERIVAFLQEHTIDGRTLIPYGPSSHWLRSFISRSQFTTDEFIAFYGFKTDVSDEISNFTGSAEAIFPVEDDMLAYGTGTEYLDRIFADTPLLGSVVLSGKNLGIINQKSREYINRLLNTVSEKPGLKAEMMITLAVINYAKDWDTEDESGFWKYITAQFGYRDENSQLRNLLCHCVMDSLVRNRRWFLTGSRGNLYKSSIMVHAFTTKRSWLYYCDFLFDFYKTNLGWEYLEDDPMIARMVLALRNKLSNAEDAEDESLEISANTYYFREGIIKLIIYRPGYAVKLSSSLLRRIDGLINHTAPKATCYEEQLCDEWMANKLQGISIANKRDAATGAKRDIAFDYTRIHPVYRLHNEMEIRLVFPDVRLAKSDFSVLKLTILHDDKVIEQRTLSYYGNELGKTMAGFFLNLEDYLRRSGSESCDPQIVISCDSEEIYNSGRLLFRKCLVFKDKTEQGIDSCEQGDYSFFLPKTAKAEFSGAEVSAIKENTYLKGYYVSLKKDFTINLNGELAVYDTAEGSEELRVIIPGSSAASYYVADGIRYRIISDTETIRLLAAGESLLKKYRLTINGTPVDFSSLPYEDSAEIRVFRLTPGDYGADEVSLRLLNLADDRMVLRKELKIIPGLRFRYNRPLYFSTEDYKGARIQVFCTQTGTVREYAVEPGSSHVSIPWQDGEIETPVPVIRVTDNAGTEWTGSNRYWIKDIPQNRFLYAKAPENISLAVTLNGRPVGVEGRNVFALGNALTGYSPENNEKWLEIKLLASVGKESSEEYSLGRIAVREQFIQNPVLQIRDKTLRWDRGYGFIGRAAAAFKLTICEGTEYETTCDLSLDRDIITENLELPLGEYKYRISKQSGNLFSTQLQTVARGSFFVGDAHELRFLKSIIQIDTITFEDDEKYEAVKILPVFIDHIEYKGIRYVQSEERECPVYNGTMYFISPRGNRHEYSYEEKKDSKGNLLYPVNPVRIVYINDRTLSITHETGDPEDPGDGFYYYRYLHRNTMTNIYQITDQEPDKFNRKDYYLADLYSYTRKGV